MNHYAHAAKTIRCAIHVGRLLLQWHGENQKPPYSPELVC